MSNPNPNSTQSTNYTQNDNDDMQNSSDISIPIFSQGSDQYEEENYRFLQEHQSSSVLSQQNTSEEQLQNISQQQMEEQLYVESQSMSSQQQNSFLSSLIEISSDSSPSLSLSNRNRDQKVDQLQSEARKSKQKNRIKFEQQKDLKDKINANGQHVREYNYQHHYPIKIDRQGSIKCRLMSSEGGCNKKTSYKCIGCSLKQNKDIGLCQLCFDQYHSDAIYGMNEPFLKNNRRKAKKGKNNDKQEGDQGEPQGEGNIENDDLDVQNSLSNDHSESSLSGKDNFLSPSMDGCESFLSLSENQDSRDEQKQSQQNTEIDKIWKWMSSWGKYMQKAKRIHKKISQKRQRKEQRRLSKGSKLISMSSKSVQSEVIYLFD